MNLDLSAKVLTDDPNIDRSDPSKFKSKLISALVSKAVVILISKI